MGDKGDSFADGHHEAGAPLSPTWTLDMPEDGWGLSVQEYVCEWCGPGRMETIYRHPEHSIGLTEEEFALEMHRNDVHTWNEETETWSR